jgi:hypothetical protein
MQFKRSIELVGILGRSFFVVSRCTSILQASIILKTSCKGWRERQELPAHNCDVFTHVMSNFVKKSIAQKFVD